MPKRVQRKRTKGWTMPVGAVYVGRPTIWGNPFWHAEKFWGVERSLALYRAACLGVWQPSLNDGMPSYYDDLCEWRNRIGGHPLELIISELRGKDLACFCPLDQPCHADVLLELANEGKGE